MDGFLSNFTSRRRGEDKRTLLPFDLVLQRVFSLAQQTCARLSSAGLAKGAQRSTDLLTNAENSRACASLTQLERVKPKSCQSSNCKCSCSLFGLQIAPDTQP